MDLKLNFVPLEILGYLSLQVPSEIFNDLKSQCFELINKNFQGANKANEVLYGAIENEYELPNKNSLVKLFDTIVPYYYDFHFKKQQTLKLSNVWINYQKKFEFNPLHSHSGDLSFVIWIQIPYEFTNELNYKFVKNSKQFQKETTSFSFTYTSNYQSSHAGICKHVLQIDKSSEGKMILFDSKLLHSVYPFFTSDEYRISISGNLVNFNGN